MIQANSSANPTVQLSATSPSQAKLTVGTSGQQTQEATQNGQPKTYKEIKQRLAQQQYLQKLRLQQQQWIIQQQQLLLQNNPGINIDQVNAIIYQQLIIQQQQHLQKVLALQEAVAKQEAASKDESGKDQSGDHQTTAIEGYEGMSSEEIRAQQQAMVQQHQHMLMTQSAFQQLIYQQHLQTQQQGSKPNQSNAATSASLAQQQSALNSQLLVVSSTANGQMGPSLGGAQTQTLGLGKAGTHAAQPGSQADTSNQTNNKTQHSGKEVVPKSPGLTKYNQMLKQECQIEPMAGQSNETGTKVQLPQNAAQPTNLPFENLKHQFQQFTSDIVRKVLARSDSMNLLRQIIDLKARKVKPKNYESSIFMTIVEKEQQRVTQENQCLLKNVLKIEDKTLVKALQKNVKKMLKPFKGLQFDDFLNNEIHLNEIMQGSDQVKDPIKESRKRHLRILDAALKEQVVDMQIVLGICVQISRQGFFNELYEYYQCACEYIMANQSQFPNQELAGLQNLKKRLSALKASQKVSIQSTKKLDRMFWLLLEQNQDVKNNITTYKDKCKEKTEQVKPPPVADQPRDNLRTTLFRRQQANGVRSSSGIASGSPRVGSSNNLNHYSALNIKSDANKAMRQSAAMSVSSQINSETTSSIRRQITKGTNRSSLFQNEQSANKGSAQRNITTASNTKEQSNVIDHLSSNTKLQPGQASLEDHSKTMKGNQLALGMNKGGTKLAPINQGKKAQSLIQKKGKAKDLESKLALAQGPVQAPNPAIERTPDHASMPKKRVSSMNLGNGGAHTASKIANQVTHQPLVQGPRGRMVTKMNTSSMTATEQAGTAAKAVPRHGAASNLTQHIENTNSTENMFNLIQATKTKNTMFLEPISKNTSGQQDTEFNPQSEIVSPLEVGAGLQPKEEQGFLSQPSRQQRQFIISSPSKGQLSQSNYHKFNLKLQNEEDPPQVLRSWSKPQIAQANLQVCTCQRFRKRIDMTPGGIVSPEDNRAFEVPKSVRERVGRLHMDDSDDDLDEEEKDINARISPSIIKIKSKARGMHDGLRDSTQSELKIKKKKSSNKSNAENHRGGGVSSTGQYINITSPSSQRPPTSPSEKNRAHQQRGSLDFKMRILTKKKVAVPTPAGHQATTDTARTRQMDEHSFTQASKIHRVGSQNNFINSQGHHQQSNSVSGISVPKQKVVTYEICQDCGGQRPVGLPEVSQSALSELKVMKLKIENVAQHNNDAYTARLDGSSRSSTLSIGERNGNQRQTQAPPNPAIINVRPLSDLKKPQAEPAILQRLNKKYLQQLGQLDSLPLLMIGLNYRAKLIQDMVRTRNYHKRIAITRLQKFCRRWVHRTKAARLQQEMVDDFAKMVAIKKIQRFSKLIKVHKVSASLLLNYHQINTTVQQAILKGALKEDGLAKAEGKEKSSEQTTGDDKNGEKAAVSSLSQEEATKTLKEFEAKLIKVQRLWRARRSRQVATGVQLVNLKTRRDQLFNKVINRKHYMAQNYESELVHQKSMFSNEQRNLDQYFWRQMVSISKDMDMKGKKIQQKLTQEFSSADWSLNPITKEWLNTSTNQTIRLEKGESTQLTTLKEKVMELNARSLMPDEETVQNQLDDLTGARNAMQTLLQREQIFKEKHLLTEIKRQRMENLYAGYKGPLRLSGCMNVPDPTLLDV